MTNDDEAATYLRHMTPRLGYVDGLREMVRDVRSRGVEGTIEASMNDLGMLFVGLLAIWGGERIWHPLYWILGIVVAVGSAWRLGTVPFGRAVRSDQWVLLDAYQSIGRNGLLGHKGQSRLQRIIPYQRAPSHRSAVLRMALVAHECRKASTYAGNSDAETMRSEARKAIDGILDGIEVGTDKPVAMDVDAYARRIAAIVDASPAGAHGPDVRALPKEARRLMEIAEKALAEDADLADGAGAPVAALVREHLPRLVATHERALLHADEKDRAVADAALAAGMESVRRSVEEALDADQRKRFDALATEVHFLASRRGEEADAAMGRKS